MTELDDTECAILDFEGAWFKFAGAKEAQIRDRFDLSATIYYRRLNALVDRPEALAYDPMGVRRLRRLRDARAQQRSSQRLRDLDRGPAAGGHE